MDGRPYILEWKRQVEAANLLGPTIYTAGPLLDGNPPLRPDNMVMSTEPEARAAVMEQYSAGYDFIKVYTNLSPETYQTILDAAGDLGLPVVGHMPRDLDVRDAFESGQTAIEHLGDYADPIESSESPFRDGYHWSKRFLGMPMDPDQARSIAERQAEVGVWTVPTLVQADKELATADSVQLWLALEEMTYVEAEGREFWVDLAEGTAEQMDDEDWELVARGRRNRLALTRSLHEAGVHVLVGTDTPNPFVVPGFSVHSELQNFNSAGLSPGASLAAATRDAAGSLGHLEEWGTVEPGKRADLLLLDANPLESVENAREPAGVMVRGQWLPRQELARLLESLSDPGIGP